jgi:hypothetical protein
MRKSFIGLMVVTLLLFAGQAGAQGNGTADPLGLIASAAIQPFWGNLPNITVFEIASPVGDNSNPDLEGLFFNANCAFQFSFPIAPTENGIAIFTTLDFGGHVNFPGLLVIGRQAGATNLAPIPLAAPIHVKGIWVNIAQDFQRPVDPISVQASENTFQSYNALRSAASFVSPLQDAQFATEIFLNCLSPQIISRLPSPPFPQAPATAFALTGLAVRGVVYKDNEEPILDFDLPCSCSSMFPVTNISPVYGDPGVGSGFFYTELVTYTLPPIPANPETFTGYRAVTITQGVWPGGTADDFGRLNNGSAAFYLDIDSATRGRR